MTFDNTMTWEVVATRIGARYVVAQFKTEQGARTYARWRNEDAQRRAWKAQKIEPDPV